jgi:DNA-binding phage protein
VILSAIMEHDTRPLVAGAVQALRDLAAAAGGVEALSRRTGIPARTLRRALAGEALTQGTRLLLETRLAPAFPIPPLVTR